MEALFLIWSVYFLLFFPLSGEYYNALELEAFWSAMEEYFEVLYEHIHFLCNWVEEILRIVLIWLKQLPPKLVA